MDGLLVVDKPVGPTSHDVVVSVRRILREARIGHTGTLDPSASGVLPLVIGRATRLARFLSGAAKSYRAVIRVGFATTTGDASGAPLGACHRGPLPDRAEIERALDGFRGTFLQQPPAFSAKRVGGRRSYDLARRLLRAQEDSRTAVEAQRHPAAASDFGLRLPEPVPVTVECLTVLAMDADRVTLDIDCSAGFYVRSLAHDLGTCLGVGAHVVALRRTRSGRSNLDDAVSLEAIEQEPGLALARLVAPADMLPELPGVVLTREGVVRAVQGRALAPGDWSGEGHAPTRSAVRLIDEDGTLVGLAEPRTGGLLHPSVVLR